MGKKSHYPRPPSERSKVELTSQLAPKPIKPPKTYRKAKLPQELIDLIIDYLWDNPDALKACSHVSHAFVFQTRLYLFAKFTISIPDSMRNTKLKILLEQSPYLAKYIKDLRVAVHPQYNVYTMRNGKKTGTGEPLLELIHWLTEVKTLTIGTYGINEFHKNWQCLSDISPDFHSMISSIILSTHIKKLSLHNIHNFDTTLVARCPALNHLELLGETTLAAFHPPPYYSFSPRLISSLTLGDGGQSLNSVVECSSGNQPAFILENILSLDIPEEAAPYVFPEKSPTFLTSALENLVIRLKRYEGDMIPVPEPIDLHHLRQLTTLSLQSPSDSSEELTFALRLARILESISESSTHRLPLTSITFTYHSNTYPRPCPLKETYWNCVDYALFELKLPPMCVVNLRLGRNISLGDPLRIFTKIRSVGIKVEISEVD